jgi:hypothetical protein
VIAPASTGRESRRRMAVTTIAQEKRVTRTKLIPGARIE